MGMNSQMDQKTKQLIESSRDYEIPEVTGQAVGLACEAVADLRIAILEQDKRARHAEEERDLFSKRIDELEAENAAWRKDVEDAAGELLVSIPSPGSEAAKMLLANRAMVRELSANRDRIAELEKPITGDVVPTNENFVRVAMAEHCAPSSMDDRYVQEWSRRFGPALDIIRARVAFKVNELETEQDASWAVFEKEALDAIGLEIIGMIVDPGTDIPGMIKNVHTHYANRLRVMDERRLDAEDRCSKAEKQRDSYKRISSIKKAK